MQEIAYAISLQSGELESLLKSVLRRRAVFAEFPKNPHADGFCKAKPTRRGSRGRPAV